jgi:glyoxylate/hydroxypyruvate reductase A
MAVLLISNFHDPEIWLPAISEHVPGVEFRVWPEIGDPADIDVALTYDPPPGLLATLPNLKAIVNLFAGVDPLLTDPDLPDVPIGRMVDSAMAHDMAQYVVLHALKYFRQMPIVEEHQRTHTWEWMKAPKVEEHTVGVMGIGAMGCAVAEMLAAVGLEVRGWSRSTRKIDGITCFHGEAGLQAFLCGTRTLVVVLPKTDATIGIINANTLAMLPRGAYLINIGRGEHVVDEDLFAALDSGQIAAATLDVFRTEPLPADNPYWDHPKVTVTPHHSGTTRVTTKSRVVAANIRRVLAGGAPLVPVDRKRGY